MQLLIVSWTSKLYRQSTDLMIGASYAAIVQVFTDVGYKIHDLNGIDGRKRTQYGVV